MNVKKLNRATTILNKIKDLDAEILILDKLAMQSANEENVTVMKLQVVDLKKKSKEELKETASYESILSGMINMSYMYGGIEKPKKPESEMEYSHELSDVTALQVFGLLLGDKMAKRNSLLTQLQKLGVNL